MAFLNQATLAQDAEFVRRVRQAMIKAAIAVSAEDPATENHANRVMFAKDAIHEPERTARVMAMGVATNATVESAGTDATDNDIEFTVNSMWDAYSGVS